MVRKAALAIALAILAAPASAQREGDGGLIATMKDLRRLCDAISATAAHSACAGYIMGAANALINKAAIDNQPPPFCFPDVYSDEMIVDGVRSWMFRNPQQADISASVTTYAYLKVAFPCPSQK